MVDPLDPFRLDRALHRSAESWRTWRRSLSEEPTFDYDPFRATREALGRTCYERLDEELSGEPLTPGLRRWVFRLAEQRVNRRALTTVSALERVEPHVVDEPEHDRLSLAAMRRHMLSDRVRRVGWCRSFKRNSAGLARARAKLWQRRAEFAVRMGCSSFDVHQPHVEQAEELAHTLLDRTDDALEAFAPATVDRWLSAALAEGSERGWPRRLSPQSLSDFFRDSDLLRSVELDPDPLPAAIAASSFVRGLGILGHAWEAALAPRDQPFVVAREPYALRGHSVAALFAGLPLEPDFCTRRLGLSREQLGAHRRALGLSALLHVRAAALRVLVRPSALDDTDTFFERAEELGQRATGAEVTGPEVAALFRLRPSDPSRVLALALGSAQRDALVQAHDIDWYRNPRAVDQLRSETTLPPPEALDARRLEVGLTGLVRTLLEALDASG